MTKNWYQQVSFKKAVFSKLRQLRAEGKLTIGQLVTLQRMVALGQQSKRSYAALAKWCQVSRSTISRTLNVAEALGIIERHSNRRRYWDGERVRVVRDIVTLCFLTVSSKVQKEPESESFVSLGSLLATKEPLDDGLAMALRKLRSSIENSGRWSTA